MPQYSLESLLLQSNNVFTLFEVGLVGGVVLLAIVFHLGLCRCSRLDLKITGILLVYLLLFGYFLVVWAVATFLPDINYFAGATQLRRAALSTFLVFIFEIFKFNLVSLGRQYLDYDSIIPQFIISAQGVSLLFFVLWGFAAHLTELWVVPSETGLRSSLVQVAILSLILEIIKYIEN